jgi:hypothetical protein
VLHRWPEASNRLVSNAAGHSSGPCRDGPNSLDIRGIGTTFRSYVACWNLHDRLVTFGRKTLPDDAFSYDHTKIEPEFAEDFTLSPEGTSVTFKLRRDATFHDGAPVTAGEEGRAVCSPRRSHDPHRLSAKGQAHTARPWVVVPAHPYTKALVRRSRRSISVGSSDCDSAANRAVRSIPTPTPAVSTALSQGPEGFAQQ